METMLKTAVEAAIKAGEEILKIYHSPDADFQIAYKSDHSPLTIADRVSNETIMQYLQTTPYPVISEENKTITYDIRRKWKTMWIVDPLDGTKEFIKRNGEFTVNIALVCNQQPILGVIYIPVKHILYYSFIEEGAFKVEDVQATEDFSQLEKKAIRLPIPHSRQTYVVVVSRSHMNVETQNYINQLQEKYEKIELISIGSSIKICLVAEGTADSYPRFAPTMEWDTAAGHAIASGAGKELYQIDEKTPLKYNKKELLNPWFIVKTKQQD